MGPKRGGINPSLQTVSRQGLKVPVADRKTEGRLSNFQEFTRKPTFLRDFGKAPRNYPTITSKTEAAEIRRTLALPSGIFLISGNQTALPKGNPKSDRRYLASGSMVRIGELLEAAASREPAWVKMDAITPQEVNARRRWLEE